MGNLLTFQPVNSSTPGTGLIKTLVPRSRQLQQAVVLFRCQVVVEKVNGIDFGAAFDDFVMQVRTGAFARTTHPANHFAPLYGLPCSGFDAHHVAIQGFIAKAVVYHHVVAIAAGVEVGFFYPAIGRVVSVKSTIQIKAICVHDLGPGGHEVVDEFLTIIILRINFGNGTQHRV